MSEYTSVWRIMPKVSLGIIFILELAIVFVDKIKITSIFANHINSVNANNLLYYLLAILLAILSSIVGWYLIKIILNAISAILCVIFAKRIKKQKDDSLFDIFAPIPIIAKRTYAQYEEFYIEHNILKSISDEKIGKEKEIRLHFANVKNHLHKIRQWDIALMQSYTECLSQDQRKIENMEEDLLIFGSFSIILALAVAAIIKYTENIVLKIILSGALLALAFLGLLALAKQRRKVAWFELSTYLDIFTVHELSDYNEHEGEVKI